MRRLQAESTISKLTKIEIVVSNDVNSMVAFEKDIKVMVNNLELEDALDIIEQTLEEEADIMDSDIEDFELQNNKIRVSLNWVIGQYTDYAVYTDAYVYFE